MTIFKASTLHNFSKLILAPHVDDECLGLGGLLDSSTHVLHFGCAENQNHGLKFHSRAERILEFQQVQSYTSCTSTLLNHPVNNYSTPSLIS